MVINPIVGVYIPIKRIPIKDGMTIPNIGSLDPGTDGGLNPASDTVIRNLERQLPFVSTEVAHKQSLQGQSNPGRLIVDLYFNW